jgi:hypothetical protein
MRSDVAEGLDICFSGACRVVAGRRPRSVIDPQSYQVTAHGGSAAPDVAHRALRGASTHRAGAYWWWAGFPQCGHHCSLDRPDAWCKMSAGNLNLPSTCMPFLAVALALPSCAFAQAAPMRQPDAS